ncbi:MAG: hypothetical protein NTX06_13900 [Proteobacteria bacterium]|nr:hypothetical protein [Pseudomonadota bacterium]
MGQEEASTVNIYRGLFPEIAYAIALNHFFAQKKITVSYQQPNRATPAYYRAQFIKNPRVRGINCFIIGPKIKQVTDNVQAAAAYMVEKCTKQYLLIGVVHVQVNICNKIGARHLLFAPQSI